MGHEFRARNLTIVERGRVEDARKAAEKRLENTIGTSSLSDKELLLILTNEFLSNGRRNK